MAHTKIVVSDLTIGYEGLFDAADLFKLIDDWFKQHGYEKNEVQHVERVREKGKFIDYEIMPGKLINEYARYDVDTRVIITNMTQQQIKKSGKQFTMNKGNVNITISAFIVTDIEHELEAKPLFFFFRTLYEKFLNKSQTNEMEQRLMNDVQNLHTELKAYLNLNKAIVSS